MLQQYERLIGDIEKARRLVILGLFVGAVLFVLFEALRGHHFWSKIKGEGNLWNYGSSLQYFMAAELALLNGVLLGYYQALLGQGRRAWSWLPWAAAGLAFAFFACDEMLEVHEKVGLALERSVPGLSAIYSGRADNLIFLGYAVGAIVFSIVFFRTMSAQRESGRYFIAGLGMIAAASLLDVLPRELYVGHLPFRESEELLELFAGFAFTAAFISSGAHTLTRILGLAGHAGTLSPDEEHTSVSPTEVKHERTSEGRPVPMVGVLIVTRNRRDDVLDCIESVFRSTYPRLAVYLVDNASTDGSREAIAERHPEVCLIRSEENLGFAAGNNLGLPKLLEDGVDAAFLLNDDVVIAEDMLDELVAGGFDDPSVGVLSPKVLVYSNPETIWAGGGMVDSRTGVATQRHYGEIDRGQADHTSEVDYAVGCAMLVKSEVIRRVGLLDSRYYMYYEESDWCRRIRGAGYRVLYVPESRVWHKVSLNADERNHASYYFSRNRLLYLSAGGTHPARVAWIALSDILRSAAVHAVKGRTRQSGLMVRAVVDYYSKNFGKLGDSL